MAFKPFSTFLNPYSSFSKIFNHSFKANLEVISFMFCQEKHGIANFCRQVGHKEIFKKNDT